VADGKAVRSSVAAEMLRVSSRTTINNWIKDGLLRATATVGGQNRIELASIEELKVYLAIEDPERRKKALEGLKRKNRGEPEPEV
jgi:excisionase family DNA binding protein